MHDFDDEKCKPDAGLEPATVGLKVQRSTDWANQAPERRAQLIIHKLPD